MKRIVYVSVDCTHPEGIYSKLQAWLAYLFIDCTAQKKPHVPLVEPVSSMWLRVMGKT